MDNIKHERDIKSQGAYHSKTIQNNKIEQNTIQNSTNMKHSYLLSSMTWTVTY